jgi:hypothetical protein
LRLGKRVKHLYHRVDYAAGKKIFGNTIGITNNFKGSLKNAQGGSEVEGVNDPRINELRTNQYLVLNNHYDKKLLDTIKVKYDSLIENEETSYRSNMFESKSYSSHISKVYKQIGEVSELITDEIKNILQGYYQGNFEVRYIEAWKNKYVPKEIQSKSELLSSHWHCDNRSPEFLKLFVPLIDLTEDDGPFHIVSQKRTKQLMKMGYGTRDNYNLDDKVINDPNEVIKITGEVGMAYFGNPQLCLHKAGVPTNGHWRDMIDFVFAPASEPLPDNWFETFEPDDNYYKPSDEK